MMLNDNHIIVFLLNIVYLTIKEFDGMERIVIFCLNFLLNVHEIAHCVLLTDKVISNYFAYNNFVLRDSTTKAPCLDYGQIHHYNKSALICITTGVSRRVA